MNTSVDAITSNVCVLLTNGQVACWGENENGEAGTGRDRFNTVSARPRCE